MESPMQAWLLSNVAGWDDDVVSAARFKALTGQRADWEGRFNFWKDLIVLLARHLNLLVIDTQAVQHSWFLRGGLTPLCMSQVLLEMFSSGDLQSLDKFQETQPSWFWQQIGKRVFWGNTTMQVKIPGRLVVTALVHERIADVTKSISESCWTTSCVTTVDHLNNICGGEEEASIIKRELIRMKRGKLLVSDGSMPIKGFKISSNQDPVSDVSKLDSYMLHLYWTLEKLSVQMNVLEQAYSRSKDSAVKAIKYDRSNAKRHIQSMHTVAASKQKCGDLQEKIREVLAFISQAEATKQVSEAMRMGANALKEHTIPLDDIEACLRDLDEAILDHNEIAEVFGSSTNQVEVDDLEAELAQLELELSGGDKEDATVVVENLPNVDNQEQSEPSADSVGAVEQAMKGLALA
ncbi:hypothetical protein GOP47_0026634 [Adiantum capillus-veneris]|nr:hypothetical protein GOP47_0026634 [Adiantum capillus-veneris]